MTWCEAGACQATESRANSVCCENCGKSLFGERHQVIEEDSVTYSLCESCAK